MRKKGLHRSVSMQRCKWFDENHELETAYSALGQFAFEMPQAEAHAGVDGTEGDLTCRGDFPLR